MNVVLTRVDSRLVHGQIVESWVPALRATAIVVANDDVARDAWRASIMRACVPDEVKVEVVRVAELASQLETLRAQPDAAIVLFATLQDALTACEGGFRFPALNLGNIHEHPGSHQASPTVFLAAEDQEILRRLQALGVVLEIRAVLRDKPLPASSFVR